MPIVTFFQTKGGTGKTTSAFLLAEIIARSAPVSIVDADPNQPFTEWEHDGGKANNFTIINEADDDKIISRIHEAANTSTFVIVDTEGSANTTAAKAASVSDLVIVTSRGKPLDQKAAAKAIKFIRDVGKGAGRTIPLRVLLTCTPAVARSRTLKGAEADMAKHGIKTFNTQLIERDAFAALFGYGSTLFDLDQKKVGGVEKAYFNAKAYANEVIRTVSEIVKEAENPAQPKTKEVAS